MYRIEVARAAMRTFKQLPDHERQRVATAIDELAKEPRPLGVKKLQGVEALYRIRVGDYGVVYQIRDRILVVLIVSIGHRKDIYRR